MLLSLPTSHICTQLFGHSKMGDVSHHNTTPFFDVDDDTGEVLDTPEKCRERRKRRIETRRWRLCRVRSEEELFPSPEFGMMSVAGRMREMEDAVSVCTELCRPAISRRLPVHFFGVYDGHGGSHVAALCKKRMHVLLEEELMRVGSGEERENGGVVVVGNSKEEEQQGWKVAFKRAFERMDHMALTTSCSCGYGCGCHPFAVALGGSTATVAVVTPNHIVVANCGDSRAVLYRGRQTLPLSLDHKPDRPDELARIEAGGGRVIFLKGARVQGILAMSRAIGDKYLKPLVISEPEITITRRDPEDECLILASDGLWDVMSSELACKVACECLREADKMVDDDDDEGSTSTYPSQSTIAAALLTRLALGRQSSDNISVIVVDLKNRS